MSKKLRTDETQESVEEWAAMIAQMQDSGKNPKWRKNETKSERTENVAVKRVKSVNKNENKTRSKEQRPQVTEMTVDGYQKHWVESTDKGWQIRIATDTQKIVINCNFSGKIRRKDGRLNPI